MQETNTQAAMPEMPAYLSPSPGKTMKSRFILREFSIFALFSMILLAGVNSFAEGERKSDNTLARGIVDGQSQPVPSKYGLHTEDPPLYLDAGNMDAAKKWEIYHECERIWNLFFHFPDIGQSSKYVDLITDDAIFDAHYTGGVDPSRKVLKGKEAILAMTKTREDMTRNGTLTFHMATNFLLTSLSETEAVSTSNYVVFTNHKIGDGEDPQPGDGMPGNRVQKSTYQNHGQARIRFVKVGNVWKMAHVELVFVFDSTAGGKVADIYNELTEEGERATIDRALD